ncbi:MAG: hypothetical protein ACJARD_000099 [Alphaproteobacteria bacterium]|jgi:hypothetical protein
MDTTPEAYKEISPDTSPDTLQGHRQKAEDKTISRLMFKFPKLTYNIQSRGDGRNSSKLAFNHQTILICSILSLSWAGLVMAYGAGVIATLGNHEIASFVYASLSMIILFPIALIWGGFFVYHYANQSHKANSAILEAARVLGSPALVAADDVKTLSLAVGHELNQLRGSMRDIEDRMHGISKNIDNEINTLNESSDNLHKTLCDVSGTIRAERDAIVDLMKIIKTENQNAHHYLAEKNKTHIQVSDTPTDAIIDPPKETGQIAGGEITYMGDLRQPVPQNASLNASLNESLNASLSQTKTRVTHPVETAQPIQPATQQTAQSTVQSSYVAKPEALILRRERQLYEGVCALTVDLNRELGIVLPQDLWSRYMRGERHIFADHLFTKLTNDFMAYQEKLDTDNVRKLCNQFISRFETLRERLFDEPDIAVSEYLENSGIGKVYSVLSVEYV